MGIADSLAEVAGQRVFCLPEGVKPLQVADVVILWLRNHPENRHMSASSLAAAALKEKFPCD
jgi:hypothetical protein